MHLSTVHAPLKSIIKSTVWSARFANAQLAACIKFTAFHPFSTSSGSQKNMGGLTQERDHPIRPFRSFSGRNARKTTKKTNISSLSWHPGEEHRWFPRDHPLLGGRSWLPARARWVGRGTTCHYSKTSTKHPPEYATKVSHWCSQLSIWPGLKKWIHQGFNVSVWPNQGPGPISSGFSLVKHPAARDLFNCGKGNKGGSRCLSQRNR